jgi:hypothetical protein
MNEGYGWGSVEEVVRRREKNVPHPITIYHFISI